MISQIAARFLAALTISGALYLTTILVGAPIAAAEDPALPAWVVADARYEGVWKTVGANTAGELDSQIILGYPGPDGALILAPEEGKIALRYGVYAVGAPNHSETNVAATLTPEGFHWGAFDPARNSAEFTCFVKDDGAALSCGRHAMFNGREFFNEVEMTRVEAGTGG